MTDTLIRDDAVVREELDGLLLEANKERDLRNLSGLKRDGTDYTLPEVLGDFRGVEGMPGWFLRPMKLRQQIRFNEASQALAAQEKEEAARNSELGVLIATLLLYRIELPGEPKEARAAIVSFLNGGPNLFRQATEDEVLDTFDVETLGVKVLNPMGFGTEETPTEQADPNADAPIGAQ